MSINSRISEIIDLKAAGSQKDFAEKIGKSRQYVTKLITEGGSVGIEPVRAILDVYNDIDARWLITGRGEMIDKFAITALKMSLQEKVLQLLSVESFIPYMSSEEFESYQNAVKTIEPFPYESKQLKRWQDLRAKAESNLTQHKKKLKTKDGNDGK